MPNRSKRVRDEDPLRSDSADSDYDEATSRATKSKKSSRSQHGKPSRKRQRTAGYGADGSEDISEGSDDSEVSNEPEMEPEQPEVSEAGRPLRKAAKERKLNYNESDDSSEPEAIESTPPPRRKPKAKSLMVKLNVRTPQITPNPTRKSTRARSGSLGIARPNSAGFPPFATRRSSRIAHDDSEPIVALTDSGHHADIVRPGTRSPETALPRSRKGGKGIKSTPSTSMVAEEVDSSAHTKDEPADNNEVATADVGVEIAASMEEQDEDAQDMALVLAGNEILGQSNGQVQIDDIDEAAVIAESGDEGRAEDEDEDPIGQNSRRITRHGGKKPPAASQEDPPIRGAGRSTRRSLRSAHETRKNRSRGGRQESSDFEPVLDEGGEENVSDSEVSSASPRKASQANDDDDSNNSRRSGRLAKSRNRSQRGHASDERGSEEAEELAEELQDLHRDRPRRTARAEILFDDKPKTRKRKPVDYRILRPDLALPIEDDGPPSATTPSRRGRGPAGGTWQRSLFSTYGPFGGAGGPTPVFGGPGGIGAAGGVDSDSSDDENMQRPRAPALGGTLGMTPTSAMPPNLGLFLPPQAHASDPHQGPSGTPANLGKIKDKQALADADPLGIDQNVNFDSVGGLQGHIDQLKEMVALPLLYPEIFQRFHVTPPRGVLFHGPPGTGKTLLARALASSVSTQGRKVTFYMRKGADALSKWVGEAERQLRLLFEEARKTQPSIIFFDEIDGLAPVRSSKQEQIHASIVSTLLALMDGMDGRGQVIVIGATNRPDSIDPALRRPGRFDREFYFPLPHTEARRSIIDIHTKGWEPPIPYQLKDELAHLTKGYGGADLRALCTEAALNAVQRRYPQIYKSNEKLLIKPETINITAKDFMISVKKIVPSSERSASSGAAPLPQHIEPLLREPLSELENITDGILPQKKRLTALEEAQFEDAEGDRGMRTEQMQQEFERSRIFRPRLLVRGIPGMGQQYLAAALLNHFEGLHVQSFDLPTLLGDSTRSPEAAVIQLFVEVRRHKPSVIYIPNVDIWFRSVGEVVISTFLGLLRSLAPTEPVLVLGVIESKEGYIDPRMIKDLFGFSKKNQFEIPAPDRQSRKEYFSSVIEYLTMSPSDFPEPANRKRRKLEKLDPAPVEAPKVIEPTKTELKAQKKKDRLLLNMLKLRIQPIMDQIRQKFKKFRTGVIDESQIRYLYDEEDPNMVTTDLPHEQRRQDHFRPFEKGTDDHGEPGLLESATGKFFYNLEIVTIEKRLSNGYYKRPKDFLSDIKKLTKDAKSFGDQDRLLKANELQANVEVDMGNIEIQEPALVAELESVYIRETRREKDLIGKAKALAAAEGRRIELVPSNVPMHNSGTSTEPSTGPVVLGQLLGNGVPLLPVTPSQPSQQSILTNGYSAGISDLSNLGNAPHSNGTSAPSHGDGDPPPTNSENGPSTERETQNSSFGPSAQTRPFHSHTGGPSSLAQRLSQPGSLSQRSAITPMAEGSHPHDYINYASTTSSDKRISGSSGPFNTQSSRGRLEGPDLSFLPNPVPANSQLPDTQGTNTQISDPNSHIGSSQSQPRSQPASQPGSQAPAVPPFPRPSNPHSSIKSLLNDAPPATPPTPALIVDMQLAQTMLEDIVSRTSSCTVEQLEQIYASLMDGIWNTRGDWDRAQVTRKLAVIFTDCLDDMGECQSFGDASGDFGEENAIEY